MYCNEERDIKMTTVQCFLDRIENRLDSTIIDSPDWIALRRIIMHELPELTVIRIGTVYEFNSSKGHNLSAVVTKENQKTWVLYEITRSHSPGTRWMIGKTWCTKENITRSIAQSFELPKGVKIK